MTITLYGSALSPFVRKARVLMAEKGIDYELDQVNVFNPPEWFLEISPLKRIPVLKDTDAGADATLPDSSVICAYLERKVPEPALYPSEPYAYGRAMWLEEYADSDLAAAIGMGCFRPVIVSQLMGQAPDLDKAEETCRERLPRFYDYLERELGSQEYFVNNAFSIADIAVATSFVNLRHAGFAPDASQYPNLTAFLLRVHARPSFALCIRHETTQLKKLGLAVAD